MERLYMLIYHHFSSPNACFITKLLPKLYLFAWNCDAALYADVSLKIAYKEK